MMITTNQLDGENRLTPLLEKRREGLVTTNQMTPENKVIEAVVEVPPTQEVKQATERAIEHRKGRKRR